MSCRDSPAEDRDTFLTALYQRMAGGNPADAPARNPASERIGDQVRPARTVLERWSFEHPEDSAAWCRRLPAGADRRELASTIVSGWIASKPERALAFAGETGTVFRDWLRRAPLENTEREKLLRAVTD